MLFRQHLPLPAAWHLFFHANDAAQDQLLLLRIFCAYCRLFLLYPLLLHYLPKPDCVGSDQFVISIHWFLVLQLSLKALEHIGVKGKVNLLADIYFVSRFSYHLAIKHVGDRRFEAGFLKSRIVRQVHGAYASRCSQPIAKMDDDLWGKVRACQVQVLESTVFLQNFSEELGYQLVELTWFRHICLGRKNRFSFVFLARKAALALEVYALQWGVIALVDVQKAHVATVHFNKCRLQLRCLPWWRLDLIECIIIRPIRLLATNWVS